MHFQSSIKVVGMSSNFLQKGHILWIVYKYFIWHALPIVASSVPVLAEYTFCAQWYLGKKKKKRTLTLRAESWNWATRELNCAARGHECNAIVLKPVAKHIKSCFYISWILDVFTAGNKLNKYVLESFSISIISMDMEKHFSISIHTHEV